eukprot:COSAG01_NODE_30325_length_618_cov_0.815029_1_plen_117_part_00
MLGLTDKPAGQVTSSVVLVLPVHRPVMMAAAAHVAAVRLPAWQELFPETVYPWLHVGWHVLPEGSAAVQSPLAPLVGAVLASQGHKCVLHFCVWMLPIGGYGHRLAKVPLEPLGLP